MIGLLAAHLVWVIARIPHSVIGKRLREIDDYRVRGDARHFLEGEFLHGAPAIEWVRAHADAGCAVLWDGEHRGSFEFAPLLLFPRPLIHFDDVATDANEHLGRPFAVASLDGRSGRIVLIGKGTDLGIEIR